MKELHRQWGHNIRAIRTGMGLSQEALAELLGVEQQSVSRWENGTAAPRDGMKLKIASALRCEVRMLFPLIQVVA